MELDRWQEAAMLEISRSVLSGGLYLLNSRDAQRVAATWKGRARLWRN